MFPKVSSALATFTDALEFFLSERFPRCVKGDPWLGAKDNIRMTEKADANYLHNILNYLRQAVATVLYLL